MWQHSFNSACSTHTADSYVHDSAGAGHPSEAGAGPNAVDRVVGVGQSAFDSVQQAYHVVADRATDLGVNAQQQLVHAAEGEGVGASLAGTALSGIHVTSNVASQALHAADQQVRFAVRTLISCKELQVAPILHCGGSYLPGHVDA